MMTELNWEMFGYKPHSGLNAATWLGIICSLGLLRLVFHWRPTWHLYCTHTLCPLTSASKILLVVNYQHQLLLLHRSPSCDIYTCYLCSSIPAMKSVLKDAPWLGDKTLQPTKMQLLRPGPQVQPPLCPRSVSEWKLQGHYWPLDQLVYVENKKVRYMWDPDTETFLRLHGLDHDVPCSYFHHASALLPDEQLMRWVLQGCMYYNHKVLEPFYIFQVFSMVIWYLDEYVYYATCIIIMSLLSLTLGVLQIRKVRNVSMVV
ncbi:ATP13A3 [Cordylochernes scorpioides]|uniref:Cation-transporting ATPase n=1 Tax=Cordylochernes scorpioides TaxID=51811 RepID=A0ABY6K5T5_9ARAC|nr:ATP13A3 [Cordylochernes scorpioides]